jgi:exosortase
MVPVPGLIIDTIILLLQKGSAEVAYTFLKLTGIPVFREGFIFHLPGISIEVARECSGIRSSIALLITSLMAGHLFLKTGSRKIILSLSIFPIAIVKNGLRIVTLSLLTVYVDERIISSPLHHKGGIVFFIPGLLILWLILWLLRKSEKRGNDF